MAIIQILNTFARSYPKVGIWDALYWSVGLKENAEFDIRIYIFQIPSHTGTYAGKSWNSNILSCQICVPLADGSMLQLVPLVLSPANILIHIHDVQNEMQSN